MRGPGASAARAADAVFERLEDRTLLTVVSPFQEFYDVDWTSAGVGGIGAASGSIDVHGINGPVTQAFLYWQGIDQTAQGGNGVYDNEVVTFAGQAVTGRSIGTGTTAAWGSGNSQAFRADVTSLVTGDDSYSLDGLASKKSDTMRTALR